MIKALEAYLNSLTEDEAIVLAMMVAHEKSLIEQIAKDAGLTLKDNVPEIMNKYMEFKRASNLLGILHRGMRDDTEPDDSDGTQAH